MSKSTLERFEAKVEIITESGCWIWIGGTRSDGYGQLSISGKTKVAHRVAYELYVGEIPEGMNVCHTCDVKSCVNPNHLFLGTQSDNMYDCVNKGRHPQTQKTHCPKGHEYASENTYINKKSGRSCRTCYLEQRRKRYHSTSP